jgi:hypothetical protein
MYKINSILFIFLNFNIISQNISNYTVTHQTTLPYSSVFNIAFPVNTWRNTNTYSQDDNRSFFVNIGFDFWYNGQRYTQLSVSTNGFIDFSTDTDNGDNNADDFGFDNNAFTNSNITQSTRPALAVLYDDLMAQGGTSPLGNSIRTHLSGSAPNRTFTVEWRNMAVYGNTTPDLNFQVQLVETTGQIIFHYGTMAAGTHTFSYSLGINSATLSNPPTTAQLRMLQVANTNNFSNGIQNNLSILPLANTRYVFTPPTPANPASNLTITGVSASSLTLNWNDWATNEVGYVIYYSTDGLNYVFAGQTSSNAIGANISGLTPSTTYYWRVHAVTEGWLSSSSNGTATTLAAGTKTSLVTGNWSSPTTWTPTGVPTAADNVIINNNHTVTIDMNAQCNALQIGNGSTGALLQIGNNNTQRTINIFSNINIQNGNTFRVNLNSNTTHTINFFGNTINNNGSLNLQPDANSFCTLNLGGARNFTITGTGPVNHYYFINQTLTNNNYSVSVSSSTFSAINDFLRLNSGIFDYRVSGNTTITPYNVTYSIFPNSGIVMDAPNSVMNFTNALVLNGLLQVKRGIINVGDATNENCSIAGGTLSVTGGSVNMASILSTNSINDFANISIQGGTITLNRVGSTNTSFSPFNIHSHSALFNWSGGWLIIPNEGGTGAQDLGYNIQQPIHPLSNVSNGTLQIGHPAFSTGTHTISIYSPYYPVPNLYVNNNTRTARPTSSLNILNNVVIQSGTLHANSQTLQIGGSWTNLATFNPSTLSLVHFSASVPQSIFRNSGTEVFHHLQFSGASVKTFSVPIQTNGNFSVTTNATVDVNATANHSLNISGNYINNSQFLARQGLVAFTGTTSQQIGGTSVTRFWDFLLNNSAGATLTYSQELLGAMTLSAGTLNTNSVLTMVSTSTATARIAPIQSGANIIGHVTVQRHIPGGSTGWANYGNPVSSPLTFNDWDDDLPISCPTCPDGSAAGFTSIWWYNESAPGNFSASASYVPMSSINDPIVYGRGYWIYVGNGFSSTTDMTLDVTGNVGKFNIPIPLSKTNHGSTADDGWNLIHNPYPSPISWTALRAGNTNVDDAIYVYNADLNGGLGGHASYVNGVSSPAIGSGGIGNNIPMFQGFYVHALNPTTLTATENIKTSTNPTFLKTNTTPSNPELLRLKLFSSGSFEDETVIYTQQGASVGNFDHEYDAYKLSSMNPNLPIFGTETALNEILSINAIPKLNGNLSIPLKLLVKNSGNFMIQISENTLPSQACINLYDKFTNTTVNLKNQNYTFYISDTTTVARFLINLALDPLPINMQNTPPNCQSPNHGTFVATPSGSGPWNYVWKWNGNTIKTSNNKSTPDTLITSNAGQIDLMVNTVGHCDLGQKQIQVSTVKVPSVQIIAPDSVNILNMPIQFQSVGQNITSWMWNFGDVTGFAWNQNPWYNYNNPGTYTVLLNVMSSDGCSSYESKVIKIYQTVGINEFNYNHDLLIIPKDFNVYQLTHKTNQINYVDVYDLTGKKILSFNNSNVVVIDLNPLPNGIYVVNVVIEDSIKALRLIKN